jgi:hypothetical protein
MSRRAWLIVAVIALAASLVSCGGRGRATPTPAASKLVLAQIIDASIVSEAGPPRQTLVRVISALPNGCHHFAGARAERVGTEIRVTVENEVPTDPHVACTMIYGEHVEQVDISAGLVSGERYTVTVNDAKTLVFTAR